MTILTLSYAANLLDLFAPVLRDQNETLNLVFKLADSAETQIPTMFHH